jgi:DNA mismatch repair ATPase MutS
MHETAYILNTASKHSLVIMDEVGGGGRAPWTVSIAWAVSEMLLDDIGCRTLFATHYHELTSLDHPRMLNMSMAVLRTRGDRFFKTTQVRPPAAGSYGLHVAGLAGIPGRVLERARSFRDASSAWSRTGPFQGKAWKRGRYRHNPIGRGWEYRRKKPRCKGYLEGEHFPPRICLSPIREPIRTHDALEALQLLSELHKTLQ